MFTMLLLLWLQPAQTVWDLQPTFNNIQGSYATVDKNTPLKVGVAVPPNITIGKAPEVKLCAR